MSKKILILNRGEIAMRAIQAAKQLGLQTILFCTPADRNTIAFQMSDEIYQLDHSEVERSYMNWDQIDKAIKIVQPDFVYPGYGFFSESPKLAELCEGNNVIFIGPSSLVLAKLANKRGARDLAQVCGLQTLELPDPPSPSEYPILLKAASGGGGRGHTAVAKPEDFKLAYHELGERSKVLFQNPELIVEKKLTEARHVELQIFGDGSGVIHNLGTRDCSIQRRYQKIIEEGPASQESTLEIQNHWPQIQSYLSKLGYRGPGTLEFLWDSKSKKIYFLEMNCRIQVEHPVTEQLLGNDLVYHQIATFTESKRKMEFNSPRGHSLELRLYAEDTANHFMPSAGAIKFVDFRSHPNVRLDMSYMQGNAISPHYDPMIGKVIITSECRERCISIALDFMKQVTILGVKTNCALLIRILSHDDFKGNKHSTFWLDDQSSKFFVNDSEFALPGIETLIDSSDKILLTEKTWKVWHR